ncbi:triose-phosphate isomerase [Candidatus Nanohalobium constans]|uniref:Triosephosphate isomerase n=1 Tax=Candidatus Nanohalobium constans TaxID=2565781 RepID=A0A5Q0UEL8_9ARCH|nr:triose-phosphate isomerase [Candidatus Nanohalobium constans]QGA80023.1 triosephosphate isomerase (TIM) [Candidatus Nanohalobium constans]
MLIINYKAYEKAIGNNSENITEKIRNSASETDKKIVVSPQTADLARLNGFELEVFAQHTDPVEKGSHTGSNQLKALEDAGITGTLINHSEKRLEDKVIEKTVKKCGKEGLTSVVCAQSPEECRKYSEFNPDYIAFEPPELIGSDTAVSTAEPDLIEEAVKASGDIPTLTGAGIKSKKDVEKSIELGCKGVLVASGVIKSENVEKEVRELCEGL